MRLKRLRRKNYRRSLFTLVAVLQIAACDYLPTIITSRIKMGICSCLRVV